MRRLGLVLLGVLLAAAPAAAQITIPNTLTAGATIRASHLNTNFSTLGNASLNRLTGGTIEGNITVNANITIDGVDLSDFLLTTGEVVAQTAGLTSAAAFTTVGDLDTGMYFPAANRVALTAGGTTFLNYNAGATTLTGTLTTTGAFSTTSITASSTLNVTGASTLAAVSATTGTFSSTLTATGLSTLNGGSFVKGDASGSAVGEGLEVTYIAASDVARIRAYDFTATTYKGLVFDGSSLLFRISGIDEFSVSATGVVVTNILTAELLKTSTALITATNGGSTASFAANMVGSTGGPTSATQNGWVKMQDSDGLTIWVPVWK